MSNGDSTPPTITPQSTGGDTLERSSTPYKKPQVAFYPNVNSTNKPQKPFSRSAAKRESVMALGSIEHLQHRVAPVRCYRDPALERGYRVHREQSRVVHVLQPVNKHARDVDGIVRDQRGGPDFAFAS